jgi:threonine dehydrogenase-like Zn-dependent dehydrogenase
LDAPDAPLGPDEIAGPTLVTLISPGTELAGYTGLYSAGVFPVTPGYSAVFRVEQVGSAVTDLRPGDLAFCMGRHRSWQVAPRHEIVPVPPGLAPETATFARMLNVTLTTLRTTTARPPDTVLITGLGLVGLMAAKNFLACGYTVIGCEPAAARRELARRAGLAHVLSAVPLDDPAVKGKVGLVLECSGHEQAVLDACRIVRKAGEVVLVAAPWRKQTDLSIHVLQDVIFRNYVTLRSGWEWELPYHAAAFRPYSIFGNLHAAMQWLAEGRVNVDGIYTLTAPAQAQAAYAALLRRQTEGLTYLFDWR